MKLEAKSRLSAATMLECGCETTAGCDHAVSALTEKQKKLDINENGKIDGDDLKKVREGETVEAAITGDQLKRSIFYIEHALKGIKEGSKQKDPEGAALALHFKSIGEEALRVQKLLKKGSK